MFIPLDVVLIWLCLALYWLCHLDAAPAPPPTHAPPQGDAEPDFTSEPPEVPWLRIYQTIALNRGDWKMADIYRDEAARLVAQQTADRLTYNQALRDRILKG